MNFKIAVSLLAVVCVSYAVADNSTASTKPPTSTVASTTATNSSTVASTAATATSNGTSEGHSTVASTTMVTSSATENVTSHSEAPTTYHTVPTTTRKPSEGIWFVEHNGTYCILLSAVISIKFQYNSTKTHQLVTNTTHVPTDAVANGSCESLHQQWIQLNFFDSWSLKMVFHKANDSKYYQSNVELKWALDDAIFKDAPKIDGFDESRTPMFNTSKNGYMCTARMTMYENSSVAQGLYGIYTEKLQLEAFQQKTETKFSDQPERCSEDTISNLVPIIVGACLGGLIIIVLIAYLIGRKRSRRGYESV